MRMGCWLGLGAAGIVGIVTIYGAIRIVTSFYDFGSAAHELPAAAAEYQANGMPFVAAELIPERIPDSQNAAPAIRAAITALPGKKADAAFSAANKPGNLVPDAILARYKTSLAFVEGALNRPEIDFRRDWDMGPYVLLPEYASMKMLAKVAVARAAHSAAKGDDETALKSLTLARHLSIWAGKEPTLISILVQISCESIALNGAEQCLDAVANSPERIGRYAKWLSDAPAIPNFANGMRGEAFMGITSTRNLDRFGGITALSGAEAGGSMPKIDPRSLRRSGFPEDNRQRGFMARHLQLWNEAYRTTDGLRQPAEKIAHRLDEISHRIDGEKGLSYVLERILLPVFVQAGQAVTQLEARRAVESGFAEGLMFHAKTGQWPKLVSGKDPFTGGALKVKVDGTRFRVYSVGKDRVDNGGLDRREKKAKGKIVDEVAVYPPILPTKP